MVERWAMIRNGVVENICLWDGDLKTWQPPEGIDMVKAPNFLGIGWRYDGAWHEPVVVESSNHNRC